MTTIEPGARVYIRGGRYHNREAKVESFPAQFNGSFAIVSLFDKGEITKQQDLVRTADLQHTMPPAAPAEPSVLQARAETQRANKLAAEFDGKTYEPAHDKKRLTKQLDAVRNVMRGGEWITIALLARATGGSEAGVSARLRDLRKPKFGGHTVERKRGEGGVFFYRLKEKTDAGV